MHDLANPDPVERLARRRAGARLGLYIHATVYLVVNSGLLVLDSLGAGAPVAARHGCPTLSR